ncbi:MAG: O-antigen ligase family protein [Thermoleophilaceae bacterium]|nr:O-antigen ligase family protein [Thermoleophilaceae bacterium]
MAGSVRLGGCAVLLAAPTVLAFFSGGFFDEPRLWAGTVAWALVALVGLLAARPLPRARAARGALAALAGLTAWMAISLTWSPLLDAGLADVERVALYLAVLTAAAALLRGPVAARAVEPALAGGIAIVCGYALATRLLPGVAPSASSPSAGPRLEQPVTYWNALGAIAAIGCVLALRLASDAARARPLRVAAAASAPMLALALYLTISRGALAATGVGVLALLALARDRRTVDTTLLVAVAGVLLVLAATRFPAVDSLDGGPGARRDQGLAVLALLLAACAAAGAGQAWLVRLEREGRRWTGALRGRRVAAAALAAALAALAAVAAFGPQAHGGPAGAPVARVSGPPGDQLPTGPQRLKTLETNRWRYWRVALRGFADRPLRGEGVHGFAALWLERRDIGEAAQDAHSLYIETLAELGVVGFLLLAAFLGCLAAAALRVWRRGAAARALATGWIAAGAVFLAHALLDWDWEMPAVALIFVLLAGALLAVADEPSDYAETGEGSRSARARPGRSLASAASSATAPSTTSAGSAANRKRVTP